MGSTVSGTTTKRKPPSSSSASNSNNSGAVDEDTFIKACSDVPHLNVCYNYVYMITCTCVHVM